MRHTLTQIREMISIFNQYHSVTINGRYHKIVLDTDNINGYGLAWMDITTHTITAQISPSTAMSIKETYLCLKVVMDQEIYREQANLTIKRCY